ncbi:Haloacid dehalogenase-like hydrolase (HAD superfamily) [Bifidobacterium saguini DSM 23967]|uniref:HAD family hydrolase n=3 Tax=Bifidobacterium TaxID=1678 RepID=A0A2N5IUF8_9BIFI|nr:MULTISPECIES: HAD-IIA family hydrolase [Bifidobacterium]KFI93106.1 Haloacid dehalogenase-like hydrolase (HAD superfamily) [Bifidobacterium saguini DSM 23967]PLS25568.1 haloacid dehalogenase [Bifidobacterium imperatoris]QSY57130.1 HAD family hydrolase [Bifidobacterium imperatoris]QTB91272.1 HAD family hydrolase [Bifidobacterium saguini]
MTRFLKGTSRSLAETYQLALLDLDGVVYRGKNPVEYAAESIQAAEHAGMTIEYTTNNSSRFQHVVADQLKGFGLNVEPWQVITSSVVAARMVAKALPAGARVQVLGADHLREEVKRNGLTIVEGPTDHPQAVIQGWYPQMTWQMMADVAFAVEAGATYFVTNRDLTIPRELGIAPGCGSMIKAVIAATGVEPVASAGKPEAYMYDEARELNAAEGHDLVPKESSIAIGDRLDTDIEAGNRGGYDSLAVLTGVTNPTELMLAPAHLRPTFIAKDLRELANAQPEPVRAEDGTWQCRNASAWYENGTVQVSDAGSIDGLRAAVCAAWEAADKGADLSEHNVPVFAL